MGEAFSYFGLTGGIACGKSTVARFFTALGARVINADRIGHEFLRRPGSAYDEIVRHFGEQVLDAGGEIDRKRLGARVFSDPEKLRELNAILHPRIIDRQEELAAQYHRADPRAVILVDAALIYEAGVAAKFRKLLAVWCRPEQQIERLMSKTGMTRAQAEARIGVQMPAEEKRRRADFVIDSSGSVENTRAQTERIYLQLQQLV